MTDQEVFDTVIRALRKQGEPAYDKDGGVTISQRCRYRMNKPDGTVLKCAAGHLIPDSVYDPRMESISIMSLQDRDGKLLDIPGRHGLLRDLQSAHDYAAEETYLSSSSNSESRNEFWLNDFLAKASKIAMNRGLSIDVIKEDLQ